MNMQQMVQAMTRAQREFDKEYKKLEEKEFTETANGVVKVTCLGSYELKKVEVLDDDLLKPENKEELQDMIVLAFGKCKENIDKEGEEISAKFKKGAGGFIF